MSPMNRPTHHIIGRLFAVFAALVSILSAADAMAQASTSTCQRLSWAQSAAP